MTLAAPLLTDVSLHKHKFSAGDRLIAKVSVDLDAYQQAKLIKTIQKFAGTELRVLVMNCTRYELFVIRGNMVRIDLVKPEDKEDPSIVPGRMDMSLSAINFMSDDVVVLQCSHYIGEIEKLQIHRHIQRWAGTENEIRIYGAGR